MSVSVQFGTCSDAINKINKSPNLGAAKSCELKDPVSTVSPYFIVASGSVSNTDNYCYCSNFGRHYWIRSIDELPGNRKGVQCEVDPLKSFAADILALDVYVARNERTGQSYLYDTEIPTESKMFVDYKKFTGGDLPSKSTSSSDMRYLLILK